MKFEPTLIIFFFDPEMKEKLILSRVGLKQRKWDLKDLLDVDGRLIRGGIFSLKAPTLHVKVDERWRASM